ncbi:ubiquitin family [Schizosaccharomyces japonicus yFS275]|uniref:Ubiquitin family n=1 Tax=Schizosaccharomyces japonicus (strain yFS275 / FY16936) TaxID=402676 RepID=B6K1H6_SCHJY|nr:ubiquitin family [Schizosaccharomyces japonicus yFS275]EEB07797.1 ubiquitin family [Schizosaccharomyces japonicus yFS275]
MAMLTVLVDGPHHIGRNCINLHDDALVSDVQQQLYGNCELDAYWTCQSHILEKTDALKKWAAPNCSFITLSLRPRVRGGKGGFGSQLRAAGGRMSRKRGEQENLDSCRDLQGRRLGQVRQAKELAEYLAKKPAETRAARLAKKEKLAKVLNAQGPITRYDEHEFFEECEASKSDVRKALEETFDSVCSTNELIGSGEGSSSSSPIMHSTVIPFPLAALPSSNTVVQTPSSSNSKLSSQKNPASAALLPGSSSAAAVVREVFGWDDEDE